MSVAEESYSSIIRTLTTQKQELNASMVSAQETFQVKYNELHEKEMELRNAHQLQLGSHFILS